MAATLLLEKKFGPLKIGYVPGNFLVDYDNDALTEREKNYIINEWKELYGTELNLHQIFKILKRRFIVLRE